MLINLGKKIQHGFTIVELLVVIVVIGILAAITIVSYTGISSRATVSSLQSDLTNAVTQLKLDQVNSSSSAFPATLALANGGKGISSSSGTTYTYAVSNTTTPQTFCITATKNNISYNITGDGNPQPGICPVLNLDAGNISSYPGSGTTWTDLSGNGNNGTLYGGVTYSAVNGGVLGFDGVNDYVSIPSNAMISETEGSMSAWVNFNNVSQNNIIAIAGAAGANITDASIDCLYLRLTGSSRIEAGWQTSSEFDISISDNGVVANTWYYLVLTWSLSSNVVKLYINGSPQVSGDVLTGDNKGTWINEFRIGSALTGATTMDYMNGKISGVNLYSIALSATEIQQNFNYLRGRYGI